jgi:hypothetical protein
MIGLSDGTAFTAFLRCEESFFGVGIYSNGEDVFSKPDGPRKEAVGYILPSEDQAYPLGWS